MTTRPRSIVLTAFAALLLSSGAVAATESAPSALTCDDFKPTQEALDRFPDLIGACESVVERDGELYAKFVAVVRRASNRSVTLYLPATDNTFSVSPQSDARVLLGGRSARVGDLARGQEIRIYLSTSQFGLPNIEEVALVTEQDVILQLPVTVAAVPALPTTASLWPALGLTGVLMVLGGLLSRRLRRTGRAS